MIIEIRPCHNKIIHGCKVCKGIWKNKCWFCGFKKPKKESVSASEWNDYTNWVEYISYLQDTHTKLKNYKMETSGCPTLDAQVRYQFGEWIKS